MLSRRAFVAGTAITLAILATGFEFHKIFSDPIYSYFKTFKQELDTGNRTKIFEAVQNFQGPLIGLHFPTQAAVKDVPFVDSSAWDLPFVDVLYEAGTSQLAFWIGQNWLDSSFTSRIDKIVNYARSKGMTIRWLNQPLANQYKSPPALATLISEQVDFISKITERWNPDYFNVVEEPSTWEQNWGQPWNQWHFSNLDWAEIINQLCKASSAETWVALTASASSDLNLSQYLNFPSLDGIGFDIYNSTVSTVIPYIPTNKKTGVTETWLSADQTFGNPSTVNNEISYLVNTFNDAQAAGLIDCFMPWFSQRYVDVNQMPTG